MPEDFKPGCQRPTVTKEEVVVVVPTNETLPEVKQSMIKVGKPAPNFTAPAFFQGKFVNTSLNEYKGKWVLLCFYPGDFTFV